jgi:CheY-like chemotaxis protein
MPSAAPFPSNPAELAEAVQYIRAGQTDEARAILADVLSREPRNEEAYIWAAVVAAEQADSIALLERVLRINPNNQVARRSLAAYKIEPAPRPQSGPQDGPGCLVCQAAQAVDNDGIACSECGCALSLRELKAARIRSTVRQEIAEAALARHEAALENSPVSPSLIGAAIACLSLDRSGDAYRFLRRAEEICWNDYHLRTLCEDLAARKPILVVEETPAVRRSICQSLEEKGFRVRAARRGREAYGKMVEEVPELILIDTTLPDMDGHELARAMRRNKAGREVPIVMIVSNEGLFDRVRARVNGVKDHLSKPVLQANLIETIFKYVRPALSPNVAHTHA